MTLAQRLAVGVGTAAVLFYLLSTTGLVQPVGVVTLALAFAIGPAAIVGIRRLIGSLLEDGRAELLRSSRVFLVAAFVIFTVMVIVQQLVSLQFREMLAAADASTAPALRAAFQVVNLVQQGLDFAFDVFYCIGLVALACGLGGHPAFGRWVGIPGVVAGIALLGVNLAAFPFVPKEAGLIDLGPVTGLWWLLVIVLQMRRRRLAGNARGSTDADRPR